MYITLIPQLRIIRDYIMIKNRLIPKKEVSRILNISPSTVSRWSKNIDNFPKPFLLGPNKVMWDLEEINQFIIEQKKNKRFFRS